MKHLIDKSIHGKTINEINKIIIKSRLLVGIDYMNQYSMISSDNIKVIWNNNITGIHTELATFDSLYDLREYILNKFEKSAEYYNSLGMSDYEAKEQDTLKLLNS